jgi:hypothetical protein
MGDVVRPPDRSERGWFAPGNQINKGNSLLRKMSHLKRRLLDAAADPVKLEKVAEVLYGIVFNEKAKNHERIGAAKLLWDTFYGKPLQSVDVMHDGGKSTGVSMADLQLAILSIKDPEDRARVAAAMRAQREAATRVIEHKPDDDEDL